MVANQKLGYMRDDGRAWKIVSGSSGTANCKDLKSFRRKGAWASADDPDAHVRSIADLAISQKHLSIDPEMGEATWRVIKFQAEAG